jgi:hypothetical protein
MRLDLILWFTSPISEKSAPAGMTNRTASGSV